MTTRDASAPVSAEVDAEIHRQQQVPTARTSPDASPEPETSPAVGSGKKPRIVVGVDGSGDGHRALLWAADEARRWGAELVVVRTWVPQGPMAGPILAPGAHLWEATIAQSRRELEAEVAPLQDGTVDITTDLVGSEPRPALVAYSEHADLIVVGTHGRGVVRRALLGSVSEHLVTHAACPVVVVPGKAGLPTRPVD